MSSISSFDLTEYSVEELNELKIRIDQEINRKEKQKVFSIRNEMESLAGQLNMTASEILNFDGRRRRKTETKTKIVRYRNPQDSSQTWSGRGKRPKWLNEALDNGAELSDFKI